MRYYIIAGEASGDLHGSNLIKELKKLDEQANIRCWGGDLMQQAGGVLVKHYRELAFMGFIEVARNLHTIFQNLRFCKKDIAQFAPDTLVLIDYPGFNLRIAQWARQQGLKVIYYISPQVWAWKENRVKLIKKCVDKMLVILPFEKEFYKKWGFEVEYVGHPLVEVVDEFRVGSSEPGVLSLEPGVESRESGAESLESGIGSLVLEGESRSPEISAHDSRLRTHDSKLPTQNSPLIALLPGSRKQEILKKLPVMLEVTKSFPQCRFVVAQAPGQEDAFYQSLYKGYANVYSVRNQTYNLLLNANAACVTSGTATLETALFAVPEVVCYKGSAVSYQIAKRLIKVKYISLVNLIMDKPVVKELIQDELNAENLKNELEKLLTDSGKLEQLKKDYGSLKNILSAGGHASANAAKIIVGWLQP